MEFITQDDLDKICQNSSKEVEMNAFRELRIIYDKLANICNLLVHKGYECAIRRDPRKQAGPGRFKFQDYHWSRVYPPGFRNFCDNEFAYIIGLSDSLNFHMMGIKDFQDMQPSLDASKACWTEIDISSANYDTVVEAFAAFDKKYRELFIDTAIELGITELLPFKKQIDMDKFSDILNIKPQIILQGPPGTGKTYTAKDIAENLIFGRVTADKKEQKRNLNESEQFEIIQFHPAYSYEDFVRGITAKGNGTSVVYETKDKVLAKFANSALTNFEQYSSTKDTPTKTDWIIEVAKKYIDGIKTQISISGGKYLLQNSSAFISMVGPDFFKYNSDVYGGAPGFDLKFEQFFKYCLDNREDINSMKEGTNFSQMHHKAKVGTYLMKDFWEFQDKQTPYQNVVKIELKNYVLIIDEINRANLPSVLGELIYALEYRGEEVNSMYELDGKGTKLILPPNLFIIGTMNLADRSVGHIDYAIRRRFAFVDILPNKEPVTPLALPLFKQVSELFIKNFDTLNWTKPELERSEELAADFRPEDVWIGHSYFVSSKTTEEEIKTELQLKLDYEIKPLLKEYLKDGLLSPKAEEKIKKLHV